MQPEAGTSGIIQSGHSQTELGHVGRRGGVWREEREELGAAVKRAEVQNRGGVTKMSGAPGLEGSGGRGWGMPVIFCNR